MKKVLCLMLALAALLSLSLPAAAAGQPPVITQQPCSPTYIEYDNAVYAVTAAGEGLQCTWYLHYEGNDYNISATAGAAKPWEAFAGETYGAGKSTQGNATTFTYTFGGIEMPLSGSYLWAEIKNTHGTVKSSRAYIDVADECGKPPVITVPASITAYKDDIVDLYCSATAPDGATLSYLWYQTASGLLPDITAVNRGSEERDTLRVPTDVCGTYHYVCGVSTSERGSAYSGIITVTVTERPAGEPPEITTVTLPDATVGVAYSATLSCTDGDAVFGIYYDPGKDNEFDQTGLNLTQHGHLEGTPAKAGSYRFTVCAAGQDGEGYMTYTLTVREAVTTVPTTLPSGDGTTVPTTLPSGDGTTAPTTAPTAAPDHGTDAALPWWGIALIALAGVALGFGATLLVLRKKK